MRLLIKRIFSSVTLLIGVVVVIGIPFSYFLQTCFDLLINNEVNDRLRKTIVGGRHTFVEPKQPALSVNASGALPRCQLLTAQSTREEMTTSACTN